MKVEPDEIKYFLDALSTRRPEDWAMLERTYYRYKGGKVPDQFRLLLDHPELAAALARDAERLRVKRELADE
jgi:hypothetical protein